MSVASGAIASPSARPPLHLLTASIPARPALAEKTSADAEKEKEQAVEDWRPKRWYRTCLSLLADSDTFGRLMEVEADARGGIK